MLIIVFFFKFLQIRLNLFNLTSLNAQFFSKLQKTKLIKTAPMQTNLSIMDISQFTEDSPQLVTVDEFDVSSTALNPNFVFVTVILTCFLILIFSIGLIIVRNYLRQISF